MSTGLECRYEEWAQGWMLLLEHHSVRDLMEEYGPFPSLEAAQRYRANNFANPGGYSVHSRDHDLDMDAELQRLRDAFEGQSGWEFGITDVGMVRHVWARSTTRVSDPYYGADAELVPEREVVYTPPLPDEFKIPVAAASVIDSRRRYPIVKEAYSVYSERAMAGIHRDTIEEVIASAVHFVLNPPEPKTSELLEPNPVGLSRRVPRWGR